VSGKFITFEGGEGSGKSTQCWGLAERLEKSGHSVVLTREPGGSPGAEDIRNLLVSGEPDKWSPTAETLLFYAARDDHLDKIIRPSLIAGKWVVCDRFTDSTRAYQGAHDNSLEKLLEVLELSVVAETRPTLTFLLDLDPEMGLKRARARGGTSADEDRFERKNLGFHTQLREAFLDIAKTDTDRVVILDGAKSSSVLEMEIWRVICSRFAADLTIPGPVD
jgi:dTMP kinase